VKDHRWAEDEAAAAGPKVERERADAMGLRAGFWALDSRGYRAALKSGSRRPATSRPILRFHPLKKSSKRSKKKDKLKMERKIKLQTCVTLRVKLILH
jgi:hypothetical protein